MKLLVKATIFLSLFLSSIYAMGRPEYAVKTTSSCVACHVSPWGCGPKTVFGKNFGSAGETPGKYSNQDLFSASLRTLSYYPTKHTQNSMNGTALMEAAGSVNAAVIEESESSSELRGVLTYNMAPLAPGAREAYLRFHPGKFSSPFPNYFMVGRFNSPFGLLTDEHRTYTRLQSNSDLNHFFTGLAFSGAFIPNLTYDLALVNDLQGTGQFSNKDITWAGIFNLRWSPATLPFFLGASQNYESMRTAPAPFATSVYGAFSFDRISENKIPVQILFETVIAKNWNNPTYNPGIGTTFVPATYTSYLTAIEGTRSSGYYGEVRYDINVRHSVMYKFDFLTLAADYPADAFVRHGIGFESHLNSNLILDCRYEKAHVGQPDLSKSITFASQDALIAVLRLWL